MMSQQLFFSLIFLHISGLATSRVTTAELSTNYSFSDSAPSNNKRILGEISRTDGSGDAVSTEFPSPHYTQHPPGDGSNNNPLIRHGDSGSDEKTSSNNNIYVAIILPSVSVLVVPVAVTWCLWRRKRSGANSDAELEEPLVEIRSQTDIDPSAGIKSSTTMICCDSTMQMKDLKCAAEDHDVATAYSIDTAKGGIVLDKFGKFSLYVPVQRNIASTTIKVSHLPLGYTSRFPNGVIPLSPPIRLQPAGFKYERNALFIIAVSDHVCIPQDAKISLWHKTNRGDPYFTELDDTECHFVDLNRDGCSKTYGHTRYISCWLKEHCQVVPCYQVCSQRWHLFAGLFAEVSNCLITNVHVFMGHCPERVKTEVGYSGLTLCQLCLTGKGTVDGMMMLDLESGFSRLEISVTSVGQHENSVSVCQCKSNNCFVHHIKFAAPYSETFDLCVSMLTDGVHSSTDQHISSHSDVLYKINVDLRHYSLSPCPRQQYQQPQLTTRSIADRTPAPPCFQTVAQRYRTSGTTLRHSNFSMIADFVMAHGLTIDMLLTFARRLHFDLEEQVRDQLNVEANTPEMSGDVAGKSIASRRQVEMLLTSCMSMNNVPCVEEIIANFIILHDSLIQIDCLTLPCDNYILQQFMELIARILIHNDTTSSLRSRSSSVVANLDGISRRSQISRLIPTCPRGEGGRSPDDHLPVQVTPQRRDNVLAQQLYRRRSVPMVFVISNASHRVEPDDASNAMGLCEQAVNCSESGPAASVNASSHNESQKQSIIVSDNISYDHGYICTDDTDQNSTGDNIRHEYGFTCMDDPDQSDMGDKLRRDYGNTRMDDADQSDTGDKLRRDYGNTRMDDPDQSDTGDKLRRDYGNTRMDDPDQSNMGDKLRHDYGNTRTGSIFTDNVQPDNSVDSHIHALGGQSSLIPTPPCFLSDPPQQPKRGN